MQYNNDVFWHFDIPSLVLYIYLCILEIQLQRIGERERCFFLLFWIIARASYEQAPFEWNWTNLKFSQHFLSAFKIQAEAE